MILKVFKESICWEILLAEFLNHFCRVSEVVLYYFFPIHSQSNLDEHVDLISPYHEINSKEPLSTIRLMISIEKKLKKLYCCKKMF